MTDTIWRSIAATPWWIFAFFIYLIWMSFLATKHRQVTLKNLFITALLFLSLSVMGLCSMVKFITITHFLIWTGTVFLGTGLGYLQFCIANVHPIKDSPAFSLPGTYQPLIALCAFLVIKFYGGYSINLDPQVFIDPKNSLLMVFLYGLLTGLVVGKLGYVLRYLKTFHLRVEN